jgi:hypothetical protein
MRSRAELSRQRLGRLCRVVADTEAADGPVDLVVKEALIEAEPEGENPHQNLREFAHRAVVSRQLGTQLRRPFRPQIGGEMLARGRCGGIGQVKWSLFLRRKLIGSPIRPPAGDPKPSSTVRGLRGSVV